MDAERERRLFELLQEAAGWPRAEWRQRAEEVCSGGPVSAEALLLALSRDDRLDAFLEAPAWQGQPTTLSGDGALVEEGGRSPQAGDQVGRYLLRELLGEGGMGQVYLAEQAEPERRVALKLVRAGLLSEQTWQRFRAEQQALARLNHPHVAQLLDADVTAEGQPFFAMEWVDGQPLDQFFENRPPRLDERLRAFLDICSAVQHAHQKQVVHRDLKPTNVLVREVEGRPVAKVIDFGIAEALDRPGERARGTEDRRLYGTLEYLAPECFDGDVDTRADVYSLGVLLYELIAGVRPFSRRADGVSELVARIRRGDTVAPSAAARTAASGLAIAGGRQRERWARGLEGDLDAVVARAMHPDRDQRYDSVADLAEDLERYLSQRPVAARAAGSLHRIGLLMRRRRGPVLAASVALLSLLVGTAGITVGMVRARREAKVTRVALDESEELSRFLTELFQESDPDQARGAELTARELLDQGAERLRDRLQDQPLTRARLLRTIGDIYARLGYYPESEPLLSESLQLYREQLGPSDPQVARATSGLAVMKTKAGDAAAAQALFEQALAIYDAVSDPDPTQVALVRYHLAVLVYRAEDYERAESLFDRACGGPRPEAEDELAGRCLEAYGALRFKQGHYDEAERLITDSLRLRERLLGPDHLHVAASLESLCILYIETLRLQQAEPACERYLEIQRRAFDRPDSPLVAAVTRLATLRTKQKRYREAETLLLERLALGSAQVPPDSALVASSLVRAAWVSWLLGEYTQARERYQRALDTLGRAGSATSSTAAIARLGLGLVLWKTGALERAERALSAVDRELVERYGPESNNAAWSAWALAGVYRDRHDPARHDLERAGELYEQALAIRRRLYRPGHEYIEQAEADYRQYLDLVGSGPS